MCSSAAVYVFGRQVGKVKVALLNPLKPLTVEVHAGFL
jgi:hypothetical protein